MINKLKLKTGSGFSLVETLVVITLFAIIGILSTRAIVISVQGSKKGSTSVTVRENLNYSLAVIERLLRNANDIETCSGTQISYHDEGGVLTDFSCVALGNNGYIASASARLTSTEVAVLDCSFVCDLLSVPPSVTIDVTARDKNTTSPKEGAQMTVSSTILLRTY